MQSSIADTTMREAADIEDSWEVLSSNSSCDSRTPVALHFPVDLMPRATSEALPSDAVSKPWDLANPPRPTSLDDASLAWRRKTAAAAGVAQLAACPVPDLTHLPATLVSLSE